MDKTNLTKMMVWESIYTAGAGILGGILAGIVFGRLIFLVLLKLIRFDVAFQFSVEPEAILISAGLFGAIFLVILIWNIFQVQRVNPVELLQGGKKKEKKEPKSKLADRSDRNSFCWEADIILHRRQSHRLVRSQNFYCSNSGYFRNLRSVYSGKCSAVKIIEEK